MFTCFRCEEIIAYPPKSWTGHRPCADQCTGHLSVCPIFHINTSNICESCSVDVCSNARDAIRASPDPDRERENMRKTDNWMDIHGPPRPTIQFPSLPLEAGGALAVSF